MKKFVFALALILLVPQSSQASVTVSVNGSNYTIPQTNEKGWGTNVTNWIQAITANTLQPIGGNFTLTSDTDFGLNFGLKSSYFKSRTSNIASTGVVRFANTDYLGWRNAANNADLALGVNGANNLTFTGIKIPTSGSIVDADFGAGAIAINHGGTGQTAKTQGFDALSPNTTKGDVIVHNGTNNVRQAIGTDGQVLTADSVQTNGLKWASPAVAVQTTKGDLAGYSTTPARIPIGTNGQVLLADSTQSLGLKWALPTAPTIQKFTTAGAAVYTTPAGVFYIRVRMVGGGGGGSGSGTAVGGTLSTVGGASIWAAHLGATIVNAGGGGRGTFGGAGGDGGTSTISAPAIGSVFTGGSGGGSDFISVNSTVIYEARGANGGSGMFGGNGKGGFQNNAGNPAPANSGGGGGGAGAASANNQFSGSGGGSGGGADFIISSPASSYDFTVGSAGGAEVAGTGGLAAGAGAVGYIEVWEYYL